MWMVNQTRSNILDKVQAVARFFAAPKLLHWQAALHIVVYIKSTSTYGITFQRGLGNGAQLELYVDADYVHEAHDQRSFSGGVMMSAGACVSFYSRTQNPLRFHLRRQSMWRWPRVFARRFSCCISEVLFFRTAMLGVPR